MVEKEDEVTLKHAEQETQLKMGVDGKADNAGVRSPTHQGTLDDGDGDDDILHAEQEIDAKMEAAEQEKKRLWSDKASEKDTVVRAIGAWKSGAPRRTNTEESDLDTPGEWSGACCTHRRVVSGNTVRDHTSIVQKANATGRQPRSRPRQNP